MWNISVTCLLHLSTLLYREKDWFPTSFIIAYRTEVSNVSSVLKRARAYAYYTQFSAPAQLNLSLMNSLRTLLRRLHCAGGETCARGRSCWFDSYFSKQFVNRIVEIFFRLFLCVPVLLHCLMNYWLREEAVRSLAYVKGFSQSGFKE